MEELNLRNESKPLMDLIETLGETDWKKRSTTQLLVKEAGTLVIKEYSGYPPFVCFRFKEERAEVIQRLESAVENYKGVVKWEMRGRKRDGLPGFNWCIEPSRVYDIQEIARDLNLPPNQYMAKYEPEFGPIAYEDLIGLTEHVRSAFEDILSNVDTPENP